jgi:glc operon protein GlcG
MRFSLITAFLCAALIATGAQAQSPPASPAPPPAPPLGAPITLDQAKKVAAAAAAESKKIGLSSVLVVVETNGALVYLEKMDGVQYGSINVAIDKAVSSALFKRPTAAVEAALRAGNTYVLQLRGINSVPGGVPIVIDGKIVGAIGASGGSGAQDSQIAQAGVDAVK